MTGRRVAGPERGRVERWVLEHWSPRRWASRRGAGVLVVVLVLGGGAAVAAPLLDAAARRTAEERVAQEAAQQLGASGAVSAAIGGGWFVPQALRGSYPSVVLRARGVPAGGVVLDSVEARLVGVDAPASDLLGGDPQVRAQSVTARVLVATEQVNAVLAAQDRGLEVATDAGEDRLHVTAEERVTGLDLALSGWVELRVGGAGLEAVPVGLDVDGGGLVDRLSSAVLGRYEDRLAFEVPLDDLPLGQRVTAARVVDAGVEVTTEGGPVIVVGS